MAAFNNFSAEGSALQVSLVPVKRRNWHCVCRRVSRSRRGGLQRGCRCGQGGEEVEELHSLMGS